METAVEIVADGLKEQAQGSSSELPIASFLLLSNQRRYLD